MKIRNLSQQDSFQGLGGIEKELKVSNSRREPKFLEELQKVQSYQLKERLENLIKNIEEQGKKLANSLTVKDLKVYKSLVKSFLQETIGKSFEAREESHLTRRGKHKIFTIVKQVDHKLEELATMVVEQQTNQLDVLAKLDEIRGLLIDTYS